MLVLGAVLGGALSGPTTADAGTAGHEHACGVISVSASYGTFAYSVRVESGTTSCAVARSILAQAASIGDLRHRFRNWQCTAGQGSEAWGLSCRGKGSLIRAYGPDLTGPRTEYTDLWAPVAGQLEMPVLAPADAAGLLLSDVTPGVSCGKGQQWLTGTYTGFDGAELTIIEGKPYSCGNLGEPVVLAVWHIHGQPATLTEYCAPAGCARLTGDYALQWQEYGVSLLLTTHGFGQHELLAVARSMALVQR